MLYVLIKVTFSGWYDDAKVSSCQTFPFKCTIDAYTPTQLNMMMKQQYYRNSWVVDVYMHAMR